MKRKDIRAGVVYAETPSYGSPNAIVFLEDEAATVWLTADRFGPGSRTFYMALGADAKPKKGETWSGRSQGYATVRAQNPADLEGLDTATELEAFKTDSGPSRDGLYFTLTFSLSKITGPYAEAVAAYEAKVASAHAERDREEAEGRAHDARLRRAVDSLNRHGIRSRVTAAGFGSDLIGMDIDNAERLLALLREEA